MRNEKDYSELGRTIAGAGPGSTSDNALERVRHEARARAAAVTGGRRAPAAGGGGRRGFSAGRGGLVWRGAVVAVAIAAIAVVSQFATNGPQLTMAFAREDALAALVPEPGYVLHLKTSEWAQNYGEDKPIFPGDEYQESWTDFEGQRGHVYWRKKADDALVSEAVVADGRSRLRLTPQQLQPGMTEISEGPAAAGLIGYELSIVRYMRESLPEGDVVGEVEIDGERYWDVRWNNVKDTAGNKLNGRALFRQPDYRPLRIERDYPGGSKGAWEVLEWEVLPLAEVDESIFELASIPSGDAEELRIYLQSELDGFKEFTPWWLGERFGERSAVRRESLVDKGDHTETVYGEPEFVYEHGGGLVGDPLTGGSLMRIGYTGSDLDTVTVTSMRPVPESRLLELISQRVQTSEEAGRMGVVDGAVAYRPSDGTTATALVNRPGATVMIETTDVAALDSAIEALQTTF